LLPQIRSAPGGLVQFCDVIRLLLAEMVPVRDLRAVAERYLTLVPSKPVIEVTEELRMLDSIRPRLPGNAPGKAIYRLSKELTKEIETGLVHHGSSVVLALEPTTCQEILSAVRTEVGSRPSDVDGTPLVVEDPELRFFVRLLIELEFPDVSVLCDRELIDAS